MPTPRDLQELAAARRAQAEALEELAALEERRAKLMEIVGLPSSVQSIIQIDTMDTSANAQGDGPGPKFLVKHPLPRRARQLKMSIPKVAAALTKALGRTIPRTTVRSWYAAKDGESARPIPEDAVRFFEAPPWSLPRSVWKNGISGPA